jgi:hypothetical protein
MKYFCSKCPWEGDVPKIQFIEAPDMTFGSYRACPLCHAKAYETDPLKMRYGHTYSLGAYYLRWE